jgi:hypothetical protein
MVLTRDTGFKPVRWAGQRVVSATEMGVSPRFAPVLITEGALGNGLPLRDMMVSPQHRMLLTGGRAEVLFGVREVLVPAIHMVNDTTIRRVPVDSVTYVHLLFDQHEIICADGAWSESFQPGDMVLRNMDQAQFDEILALFPELDSQDGTLTYPAARVSLKAHEARVLLSV